MDLVIKELVKQFAEEGLTEDEISNCISSVWSILFYQNVKCCQDLNLEMQKHGWQDFELDEQAFKTISFVFTN